jgi:deoxycytidine triphosphate deaminase
MSHGVGSTEEGELITALQPFAFPLKVTCGKTRLSQTVVRYKGTPYMTNNEVLKSNEIKFEGDGVSLEKSLTPKGLLMQFNTDRVYRAKQNNQPIDMDAKNTLQPADYFELIEGNSQLTLDKKTLYLIGSLGIIDLREACGLLSREQEVITGTGAWSHFAGIFQPFFKGGITMEFYSHSKRRLSRGDKAGVVVFDKVEGVKEKLKDYGGAYQGQRPPRLPKMFRAK